MAFFGLEHNDLLEKEKQKFLQGGAQAGEDLAVYTWGEENYDGLGDALQEGGDDFNDETFGGSGPVGKDFNFAGQALRTEGLPQQLNASTELPDMQRLSLHGTNEGFNHASQFPLRAAAVSAPRSAQSVWEDKSPMLALPRIGSAGRLAQERQGSSAFSPFDAVHANDPSAIIQPNLARNGSQAGYRTAQEVEEEMRIAAMRSREVQAREIQAREAAAHEAQQMQEHYERLRLQELQQNSLQNIQRELELQQQARTPPPRMHPHSQSPRFHHQLQQQILITQQREQQREQHQLHNISAQLRQEELARLRERELAALQGAAQMHVPHPQRYLGEQQYAAPRLGGNASLAELRMAQELQQLRRQSPAFDPHIQQLPQPRSAQYLPDDIQVQQLLLSRSANDEFLREMVGNEQVGRRIMEAERMEERRRRKAAKISHMARYNDLMTQSDKDFITRIQVSQLVTQDPYSEDFYAQIYGAIMRSKMGLQVHDHRVLNFGSGGGVGLGMSQRPSGRRASAMQKMEAQVEKIVQAARIREKEKGVSSLHSLQGALGKTAGRSYKAAPRQLLQVNEEGDENDGEFAAKKAAQMGHEALGNTGEGELIRRDPLTRKETLATLEKLYDLLGSLEARERERPAPEEVEAFHIWSQSGPGIMDKLWEELKISVPLETSNPHPFVSLLMPAKGKRLLPRLTKYLSPEQNAVLVTLLVATFSQLDVVIQAPLLDSMEPSDARTELDSQNRLWLDSVSMAILPTVSKASLLHISSWIGMLLERTNVVAVASTEPGLTLLTMFLSRTEQIIRDFGEGFMTEPPPTAEEAQQWSAMYNYFFQTLAPHLMTLFPSVRMTGSVMHNEMLPCAVDFRVWQFLGVLAANGVSDQWAVMVGTLKEKIRGDVQAAHQGRIKNPEERLAILANTDLLLHVIGLDSSQLHGF